MWSCLRHRAEGSEHDLAAAQLAAAATALSDNPGDDLWDWDPAKDLGRQSRAAKRKLAVEAEASGAEAEANKQANDVPEAPAGSTSPGTDAPKKRKPAVSRYAPFIQPCLLIC